MILDEKQKKHLLEHINKVWKDPVVCSICKGTKWDLADKIFELREFNGGSLVIGKNSIIPVIPIICRKCGKTHFISAINTGLIDSNDSKEKDTKKE